MKVIVTKKDESVIYGGVIYKNGDAFDMEDVIAESLIERGYVKEVTEEPPADENGEAESLEDLSYADLKKKAAEMGLDAKGKKDDLIARIESASDEEDELPNTDMPE